MYKIDVVFGTVELQQQLVFDGDRAGYKSRKVIKDRGGDVIEVGPWNPPVCWLVFGGNRVAPAPAPAFMG